MNWLEMLVSTQDGNVTPSNVQKLSELGKKSVSMFKKKIEGIEVLRGGGTLHSLNCLKMFLVFFQKTRRDTGTPFSDP